MATKKLTLKTGNKNTLDDIRNTLESSNRKYHSPKPSPGRLPTDKVIPPSSVQLALSIGTGGIPRGSVVQVWGKQHGGKTTFVLNEIARAQQAGVPCVFIDAENAFNPTYAAQFGIDTTELIVVPVMKVSEVGSIITDLVSNHDLMIVVDSIAGVISDHEAHRDVEKDAPRVGGSAQEWTNLMSKMRALNGNSTIYLINQIRSNLNKKNPYDKDYQPFGGRAVQHALDVSLEVSGVRDKKNEGYHISSFRIDKNRFDSFGKEVRVRFHKGNAYDTAFDLMDAADMIALNGIRRGELSHSLYMGYKTNKTGSELESTNRYVFSLELSPEVFDALEQDGEEDLVKNMRDSGQKYYCPNAMSESKAAQWLRCHRTVMDLMRERLLDTLNDDAQYRKDHMHDYQ